MKNIGEVDQVIRVALASVLVIVAIALQGYFWWLLAPAAVLYMTGSARYCPLYVPFRINTNRRKTERHA